MCQESESLRLAIQAFRQELPNSLAADALMTLATLYQSLLDRAVRQVEQLEEAMESLGARLPQGSEPPVKVALATALVWSREQYLQILRTRRRTDGRSSTH